MKKRIHAYFSGTVQGVGFRYAAERLADELKILGCVRNPPDGRVEIIAEAKEPVLKNFLRELRESFSDYVTEVDTEYLEATDDFKDFTIRF